MSFTQAFRPAKKIQGSQDVQQLIRQLIDEKFQPQSPKWLLNDSADGVFAFTDNKLPYRLFSQGL